MTKITQHKHCYGTMFHDSLHFSVNEKMQGKVFSFELDSAGLGPSARTVQSDIAQWDDCLACPEFNHCYKFCGPSWHWKRQYPKADRKALSVVLPVRRPKPHITQGGFSSGTEWHYGYCTARRCETRGAAQRGGYDQSGY